MNTFYVSPNQVIKDKTEFAKKGIEKGRTTVSVKTTEGLLFVADNPSKLLFKTSEIYDKIGFAGAGKYSEFENLRISGIQHADLKGFNFSINDVYGLDIASLYSQALVHIFNNEVKPYEVEIIVGEFDVKESTIYHVSFDGTLTDKSLFSVIGGNSEILEDKLSKLYKKKIPRDEAIKLLKQFINDETPSKTTNFEISILEDHSKERCFKRL